LLMNRLTKRGRLTNSQIVEGAFWLILVVFFFAYSFEFNNEIEI